MTWDPSWDTVFRTHEWSRYPPEELVRFVATHMPSSKRGQVRVLEMGCGTGANIWFLARERFDVYGIDGSQTAISRARGRLLKERLKAHLKVGDIVKINEFYKGLNFDAIFDVACLQHNRIDVAEQIMDRALGLLKPGGRFFSMMAAKGSYLDRKVDEVEPGTFAIHMGSGATIMCHLYSLREIKKLFERRFADVHIEYSIRSLNNRRNNYKNWVTDAYKRV